MGMTEALSDEAKHKESWYQAKTCAGKIEYRLDDRTRIDCLTKDHAIEYDFANKWKESIGQSMHYAIKSNKQAGIVLIMRKDSDDKYLDSLMGAINFYVLPIDVWIITTNKDILKVGTLLK